MTKPVHTESIEKATGKPWAQWVCELDDSGARQLSHAELARSLSRMLDGVVENNGWWAQSITVAYEQHIGRRVPGQLANGLFELAVSKTATTPRDELFQIVVDWFEKQTKLNGCEAFSRRSSKTPNRSTWRCDFADGSKFSATVEMKNAKTHLVLSHTAVPTVQIADGWKRFWRDTAERLTEL